MLAAISILVDILRTTHTVKTAVDTISRIKVADERNSKSIGRLPFLVIVAQRLMVLTMKYFARPDDSFDLSVVTEYTE